MKMQIKRVVLLGRIGGGKTTLFNKITKSNQQTESEGNSVTIQIVKGTTQFGQGFEVIDTPGFGSSKQKTDHAAGILAALSYGQVNRILIIAKFENRDDEIIKKIKSSFEPLFRFKNLVTVIITHWDQCDIEIDQQKKRFDNIKSKLFSEFNVKSVLKFSKRDRPSIICNEIDQILFISNAQESQEVKLLESEIYKYFNLLDNDKKQTLETLEEEAKQDFKKITNYYKNLIESNQNYINDEDQQEIFHQMILKIKEEANEVVKGFEKKYFNGEIQKLLDEAGGDLQYLHYISLKKAILMEVENFIQILYVKMKGSDKHFFQFLRKCPNPDCGQIWFKVIGCDGETTCGNRVTSNNDEFVNFQRQQKIVIKRENNVVRIEKFEETQDQHLARIKQTIKTILLQEKIILENLEEPYEQNLDQVLKQYLSQKNINNLTEYNFYIGLVKNINKLKGNIYQDILFMKGQLLYHQPEFNQIQTKGIGCGNQLIWRDLKTLQSEELQKVLSSELLEYFADQEQLQNDEITWLDKHYKTILENRVKGQLEEIKDVAPQFVQQKKLLNLLNKKYKKS